MLRSLPDDEEGRKESTEIYRLLQTVIETEGAEQEKVKLKTALEYFSDKFSGKLPILIDKRGVERRRRRRGARSVRRRSESAAGAQQDDDEHGTAFDSGAGRQEEKPLT